MKFNFQKFQIGCGEASVRISRSSRRGWVATFNSSSSKLIGVSAGDRVAVMVDPAELAMVVERSSRGLLVSSALSFSMTGLFGQFGLVPTQNSFVCKIEEHDGRHVIIMPKEAFKQSAVAGA